MDIEFVGFAGDCRIVGRLASSGERLTDRLNAGGELVLAEAQLESLDDGHTIELPELVIEPDELYAAMGTGPRGDVARRIRTRPHRMQLSLGPYLVLGQLHALPGNEALASILRRGPMVPLTDSTLTFTVGRELRRVECATLIVNRTLADWIVPTANEALAFPGVAVVGPGGGPTLAKDFTGILRSGQPL